MREQNKSCIGEEIFSRGSKCNNKEYTVLEGSAGRKIISNKNEAKQFTEIYGKQLTLKTATYGALLVPYMYYFSTACRRELVAIFKVSGFPFLNCFASSLLDIILLPALPLRIMYSLLLHLDPHEKISSQIQDLFCSRKPLTYPGSASVQCGLHRTTDYQLSQALTYFTQTSASFWTVLLSRK